MTTDTTKNHSLNVGAPTAESIALSNRATKTWGTEKQTSVCIGEIGELLTLFGRDAQGRTTKEDWCSEIADVIICAWQLSRLAGIDIETQNNMICHKLNRVNHKLTVMEQQQEYSNKELFDKAVECANARIKDFQTKVKNNDRI